MLSVDYGDGLKAGVVLYEEMQAAHNLLGNQPCAPRLIIPLTHLIYVPCRQDVSSRTLVTICDNFPLGLLPVVCHSRYIETAPS